MVKVTFEFHRRVVSSMFSRFTKVDRGVTTHYLLQSAPKYPE